MAVRDDPNSRLKAADAKAAFTAPRITHTSLARLCDRERLKAIVGVRLRGPRNVEITPFSWDSLGSAILHEWMDETWKRAPEAVLPLHGALLLAIHEDGGLCVCTWGADAKACAALGDWGGRLLEMASHAPFNTYFGAYNNGVPVALTSEEAASLSEGQRRYAERVTHKDAIRVVN